MQAHTPTGAVSYQVIGMLHEPLIAAPVANVAAEPPAPLDVGAEISVPPATGEQVRTADAVVNGPTEGDKVLGMLGMWTGVLLLHDLTVVEIAEWLLDQKQPKVSGKLFRDFRPEWCSQWKPPGAVRTNVSVAMFGLELSFRMGSIYEQFPEDWPK